MHGLFTLYFSRHCLPVRPGTERAISAQLMPSLEPLKWLIAATSADTSASDHFLDTFFPFGGGDEGAMFFYLYLHVDAAWSVF